MEQTLRQRAEALLELASNATDEPWELKETVMRGYNGAMSQLYIAGFTVEMPDEEDSRNGKFIAASRTEAPYLAQKLIEALDVIHGYESECMCRVNDNGRCERCQKAHQFLQERSE